MSILARLENIKRLWQVLLPTCQVPQDQHLGLWASRFTEDEIEYAVARTARKFRLIAVTDDEQSHRYCTGVLHAERKAKELKNVC